MTAPLLAQAVAEVAQRQPERAALVCGERSLTYRELDAAASAFAGLARAAGLRPGDRIVYLGRNSEEYFPVLLGSVRAQTILVPLNWRLAEEELRWQFDDVDPALIVADEEYRSLAEGWSQSSRRRPPVLLTASEGGEVGTTDDWLLTALRTRPEAPSVVPDDPEQIIVVLYTGGTTGRPKGVMLSHGAVSESVRAFSGSGMFDEAQDGDVLVSPLQIFHSGGNVWVLIGLAAGFTNVIIADQSPQHILEVNLRHKPAYTFTVPTVLRRFVDEVRESGDTGWRLKAIGYGAGGSDRAFLKDAYEVLRTQLVSTYGLTELSGTVTYISWNGPEDIDAKSGASVGKALKEFSLEIRDPSGRPLPVGSHGEIWVTSQTLFSGYLNHPGRRDEVVQDGWYGTGDGGYLDHDGYLYLTDRIKDMIITGGENVYPAEVEEALRRHPSVYDAGVVGVPDEEWGERIVAIVELAPSAAVPTETELRDAVRAHLAGYKVPKSVLVVDALPRTAQGKVQRHQLRELAVPSL